ncbi:MAG: hypothetical protein ACJA0Q_000568 [Saprospiraceae bacterium]|jgi:hypothetical protein
MIKNNLPDSSKVWVYQSNVKFTDDQLAVVESKLSKFLDSWDSHGTALNAATEVLYNQFIVIFVDEHIQQATGCSIDKSVALIKSIESETGVDLMNRMNIAYLDKEEVAVQKMMDFQSAIKSGTVNENTMVFNNLVQTKGEFLSSWEVRLKDSWHKQLLQ